MLCFVLFIQQKKNKKYIIIAIVCGYKLIYINRETKLMIRNAETHEDTFKTTARRQNRYNYLYGYSIVIHLLMVTYLHFCF